MRTVNPVYTDTLSHFSHVSCYVDSMFYKISGRVEKGENAHLKDCVSLFLN